jgi:hypothetical protein
MSVLDLQALDAKGEENTRLPSAISVLVCGTNSAASVVICY